MNPPDSLIDPALHLNCSLPASASRRGWLRLRPLWSLWTRPFLNTAFSTIRRPTAQAGHLHSLRTGLHRTELTCCCRSKWSTVTRHLSLPLLMMVSSEEAGRLLQGSAGFSLRVRLRHGNRIDCSSSAVLARWRWLGIFSLAPLDRVLARDMVRKRSVAADHFLECL